MNPGEWESMLLALRVVSTPAIVDTPLTSSLHQKWGGRGERLADIELQSHSPPLVVQCPFFGGCSLVDDNM